MSGVTYDAGALIAAERNHRQLWALHRRALERGHRPTLPAGVLAQVWRGGPQPEVSRFIRGCVVEVLDMERAKSAGTACERSGRADVVDATVVVGALTRRDLVVTSDPEDLLHIAASLRRKLRIQVV